MKRALTLFVLLVVSIGVVVLTTAHSQNPNGNSAKLRRVRADKKIPNQYIVVFKDDVKDVDGEAFRLSRDFAGDRNGGHTYKHALKGFSVRMSEERAAKLANDPRVAYVEEDGVISLAATQTNPPWGLDRIDQRNRPIDGRYTYNATGTGVKVYIIDTGVRATHTDFGGRVISGFTLIHDGLGTNDPHGHGTHVAGTVGGSQWGVAKNVTIVAVRVFDAGGNGVVSRVIGGVDYVTENHQAGQPAVANLSFRYPLSPETMALETAVNNSINDGVTYVVAAGNDNLPACQFSPARVGAAITVGATTQTDARSSFSNYGTCVDIFAPGTDIISAGINNDTASTTMSGTSQAAPHVAGVAALYLEQNPSASPAAVAAAIIGGATQNVVTNVGPGSPNRLLYAITNVVAEPFYEGFIDHVSCDAIAGWAADRNRLNTSINVTIYDGAIPVATVLANELRSGVGDYLGDNGRHGFAIPLPSRFKNGKPHTLRVRAEESTVDLINSPQSLACSSQYTYYEVVARHSGKCLDVFNGSTQDGASVIQWPCTGDLNQQWQVIPIGEGYIKFIARHSNKALAVESLVNGAPAMQLTVDGSASQQWQLVDLGGGYLGFMTRQNGKALEVAGGSIVDGAQVQQWSYSGALHQQWLVRPRN